MEARFQKGVKNTEVKRFKHILKLLAFIAACILAGYVVYTLSRAFG
jgi:hypothetical protein